LSWEATKKADIALDLALFKNRFQVSVDFYRNKSNSLVGAIPIAEIAGISSFKGNIADATIRNQGVELELVSTNISTHGFQWITNLILTVPEDNTLLSFPGLENTSYAQQWQEGRSLNVTHLYKHTGINPENGIPLFENIDDNPEITTDDKQFLQDTDRDFYGGLQNSFRYKGIQLDIFFLFEKRPYQKGFLATYKYPAGYLDKNIPRTFTTDYWSPENPNGKYPGLTTTTSSDIGKAYYQFYTSSSAIYSDASFISLKNVALAYYLPQSILSKVAGVRSARVYLRGENLATFTKFNAWNPETEEGSAIPPFRTITAGVSLSF
jgi:hypothetical protein